MRVLALAQAEPGPEVGPDGLALGGLLDGRQEGGVHLLLVLLPLLAGLVLLLLGLEDVALLLGA